MKILGIDLSLTCPCVCAFTGDELNLSQCEFFYYTDKKKLNIQKHPIYATLASVDVPFVATVAECIQCIAYVREVLRYSTPVAIDRDSARCCVRSKGNGFVRFVR